MNRVQVLWGSLLVILLTSCGDNTASTVSPTGTPAATGSESMNSSPLVESTAPLPSVSTSSTPSPSLAPSKISKSPVSSPAAMPSVADSPVAAESETSSLDGGGDVVVSKASLAALKGVVDTTKTAIEEGKLDEAKTEFAKFDDSWLAVEDGIRSKSADTHKSIKDGVKSVNSGIASKQAKATLLASLQKLSDNLDSAGN